MAKTIRLPFINRTVAFDAILPLSSTVTVAVGVALARDHLRSACRFARLAYRLEHGGGAIEAIHAREEHDSCVAASIIFAGAFLDSEINYQFATAAEAADPNALADPMRGPVRAAMAAMFTGGGFRNLSVFQKYQELLRLAGKTKLPEKANANPYTDALLLTQVRNQLVHYQQGPVTVSTDDPAAQLSPEKFSQQMLLRNIAGNPLAAAGEPYFPRRMLSHALANAGIIWGVAWVDAFYARLGVNPPPLDAMRNEIITA
jgi:hypothetical protein